MVLTKIFFLSLNTPLLLSPPKKKDPPLLSGHLPHPPIPILPLLLGLSSLFLGYRFGILIFYCLLVHKKCHTRYVNIISARNPLLIGGTTKRENRCVYCTYVRIAVRRSYCSGHTYARMYCCMQTTCQYRSGTTSSTETITIAPLSRPGQTSRNQAWGSQAVKPTAVSVRGGIQVFFFRKSYICHNMSCCCCCAGVVISQDQHAQRRRGAHGVVYGDRTEGQ